MQVKCPPVLLTLVLFFVISLPWSKFQQQQPQLQQQLLPQHRCRLPQHHPCWCLAPIHTSTPASTFTLTSSTFTSSSSATPLSLSSSASFSAAAHYTALCDGEVGAACSRQMAGTNKEAAATPATTPALASVARRTRIMHGVVIALVTAVCVAAGVCAHVAPRVGSSPSPQPSTSPACLDRGAPRTCRDKSSLEPTASRK